MAVRPTELGVSPPERGTALLEAMTWDELKLVSSVGGAARWLEEGAPLRLTQVRRFAVRSDRPFAEIVPHLRKFGFVLAGDVTYG